MDEQSIFFEALDKSNPEEQDAWLQEACAGDQSKKLRILELLKKHKDAPSFLEQPAEGLDATFLNDVSAKGRAASLEAGLASAFHEDAAVVIGNAGHSVLRSLGQTVDVPAVMLREPPTEGNDPITRPMSTELPDRNADSRYRIDGEIARGGMGAILKGRDTDLGRDLAIKVLLESHKEKPELIQRFVEEAQIGGQLQHPGIAPVYELGQFSDQRPFFSMKLVKGETLSKLLAARKEPTADRGRFLNIFEQVCQTMAYAHSRGVIHRDLKPANIMVGAFGEVQVMDWGLAKVLPSGGVADEKTSQQKHQAKSIIQTRRSVGSDTPGSFGSGGSETQMGSVMGTPAYMPPEQALGEIDQLDHRADVFALGAILCEILTGQPPYVADDATQVFRMASRGKLNECLRRLDDCSADSDLIKLTINCLEVEPADRPQDAGELAEQVTNYLESVETKLRKAEIQRATDAARAMEEKKRRRATLAMVTGIILLLGVVGAFWLNERNIDAIAVNKILSEARQLERQSDNIDAQQNGGLENRLDELEKALAKAESATLENNVQNDLHVQAVDLRDRLAESILTVKNRIFDRGFQENLDSISFEELEYTDLDALFLKMDVDSNRAIGLYQEAFRSYQLDVVNNPENELASRVAASSNKESLIKALDGWARALQMSKGVRRRIPNSNLESNKPNTNDDTLQKKLVRIANLADHSESRIKLRTILEQGNIDQLREFAENPREWNETSTELPIWLASALIDAKEYLLARQILERGVLLHPGDFWMNHELAMAHSFLFDLEKAVEFFRTALAIRPQSIHSQFLLASTLIQANRKQEAFVILRRTIEIEPRNYAAHVALGSFLSLDGKPIASTEVLKEAVNIDPDDVRSIFCRAFILFNQGKFEDADVEVRNAIKHLPNSFICRQIHGWVLRGKKDFDASAKAFEKAIEISPNVMGGHVQLGITLRMQEKFDESAEAFKKAIEISPNFPNGYLQLGTTLWMQGKFSESSDALLQAFSLNPDSPGVAYTVAFNLQMQGNVEEAIELLSNATRVFPENAKCQSTLAYLLALNGEHDQALEKHDIAIKLEPKNAYHYGDKAFTLVAYPQTEEESNDEFVKKVKLGAELAKKSCRLSEQASGRAAYNLINTLGVALYRTGEFEEAIEKLKQSDLSTRKADYTHPINMLFIAMSYKNLEQDGLAKEWYSKALKWRKAYPSFNDLFLKSYYVEAQALFAPDNKLN